MQLMGFVDSECDGAEWQSPLSDQAATLLMTASRHKYYTQVQKEGVNDGYVYEEYGDSRILFPNAPVWRMNTSNRKTKPTTTKPS